MDAVVNKPFVIIYLNTETVEENVYDSDFYKQLFLSVDDRYINHLRGLYIVHPSFWMKVSGEVVYVESEYMCTRNVLDSMNEAVAEGVPPVRSYIQDDCTYVSVPFLAILLS